MPKCLVHSVNPTEIMLENILAVTEKVTFGKDVSAMIVGGVKKLENLIAAGKIRAEKRSNSQSGKWFCNASDVLRHSRNMRN